MRANKTYTWAFVVVLVIALVLRLTIVSRGGQFFWGDEDRYVAAENAWKQWESGAGFSAGLREVLGGADHLGFKVMMLGPAWVQRHTTGSYLVPSVILSLVSLLNIVWVWLIARRSGGTDREAFWAAAAMAGANSMFYWARHLMPYDVALCWALACLYVAVKPGARWWDSILAGALGCLAFVTYNGYWAIVACTLTLHVLLSWPSWRGFLQRAVCGLAGLIGTFVLILEIALRSLDLILMESYLSFAGSINQGEFRDGALVFFDYFWQTERGTALIWVAALLGSAWLFRRADGPSRRRGLAWVGSIVVLIGILIVGANVLEKFVVYGRLARQVTPFCALLVGWTAGQIFQNEARSRIIERWALGGLALCALWSMWTPLRQRFPVPFRREGEVATHDYRVRHVGTAPEKFRFLYTGFIWPYPNEAPLPARYETLMASPHPLAWRPYLYEGFNREQRKKIETTDITMRLLLLKD